MAVSAPGLPRQRRPARRLALLGGMTTWGDCAEALGLLASPRRLVQGPEVARYEREFAVRIGVAHALSFAHGRIGLYAILRGLGVGPGDEVLVPVPTHVVVANAVRYVGARPIFVDCLPDSWNVDLRVAAAQVTSRTRALILQHTFGVPADIEGALALGRRHDIPVVEDCVHALGARHRGRPVGSFGRAAFFSTEETKTISTTMGGMAVTDDPALATSLARMQARCAWPERRLVARYVLKLLGYHALTQPRLHRYTRDVYEALGRRNPLPAATSPAERRGERPAGYEQRLGNAQAVLALRQLGRLDANVAHRRRIAEIYAEGLGTASARSVLAEDADEHAPVRFPLHVPDRESVASAIAPLAVPGRWFTSVLEEAQSPALVGYQPGSCPVAEDAARHLLNLPTHPRVRPSDARAIVAAASAALAPQQRDLVAAGDG
jgi:perosamine synthetase